MKLDSSRMLLMAWTGVSVLFGLFTLWAFYIQIALDNSILPAVLSLLVTLQAVSLASLVRKARREHKPAGQYGLLTLVLSAPWVLFWAWVADRDDAPGAMLIALGFLCMAGIGLWTFLASRRANLTASV